MTRVRGTNGAGSAPFAANERVGGRAFDDVLKQVTSGAIGFGEAAGGNIGASASASGVAAATITKNGDQNSGDDAKAESAEADERDGVANDETDEASEASDSVRGTSEAVVALQPGVARLLSIDGLNAHLLMGGATARAETKLTSGWDVAATGREGGQGGGRTEKKEAAKEPRRASSEGAHKDADGRCESTKKLVAHASNEGHEQREGANAAELESAEPVAADTSGSVGAARSVAGSSARGTVGSAFASLSASFASVSAQLSRGAGAENTKSASVTSGAAPASSTTNTEKANATSNQSGAAPIAAQTNGDGVRNKFPARMNVQTTRQEPNPSVSMQVISSIRATLARNQLNGAGETQTDTAVLSLRPAALGQVTIRLEVSEGVVSASFESSTSVAHDLLKSSVAKLREQLEARGLSVDRLDVTERVVPRDEPVAFGAETPTTKINHDAPARESAGEWSRESGEPGGDGASREGAREEPSLASRDRAGRETNPEDPGERSEQGNAAEVRVAVIDGLIDALA